MRRPPATSRPPRRASRRAPRAASVAGVLGCAVWLAVLAGCGKPQESDAPVRPTDVRDFDTLFATHCVGCHGAAGKLGPAPPLADPLFLAITGDDELRKTIAEGRAGYLMPPFAQSAGGPLVDAQVTALVEGIRSKWGDAKLRDGLPDWVLAKGDAGGDSATGAGDAAAGEATYTALCMTCHGSAASGDMSAPNSPEFLKLMSDQTLRRILITGRSDLGMPDYDSMKTYREDGEPLGAQDVADLLAYLAECREKQLENGDAVTRTGNR